MLGGVNFFLHFFFTLLFVVVDFQTCNQLVVLLAINIFPFSSFAPSIDIEFGGVKSMKRPNKLLSRENIFISGLGKWLAIKKGLFPALDRNDSDRIPEQALKSVVDSGYSLDGC